MHMINNQLEEETNLNLVSILMKMVHRNQLQKNLLKKQQKSL
jgi:hypothetical protein